MVIGCGVIGIEYASMFAALGVKVTVIDGHDRPLEFLDQEIVDELVHQLRKCMVTFRLGETVSHIETREGPQRQAVDHLQSGKRLVGDLVLACTGRVGASDVLKLERAGLSADTRGRIKVDGAFRSDVPHIFAAGDVIGYPSLAATSRPSRAASPPATPSTRRPGRCPRTSRSASTRSRKSPWSACPSTR